MIFFIRYDSEKAEKEKETKLSKTINNSKERNCLNMTGCTIVTKNIYYQAYIRPTSMKD